MFDDTSPQARRSKYPHLTGCMTHFGPTHPGKGLCFHRSAALVLDLRAGEVVMGTFRAASPAELKTMAAASMVPFIHCWVERAGEVWAATLIERMGNVLTPIGREAYYRANGAHDIYRLGYSDLLKAAAGTGISAYFRTGSPLIGGRTVGDILLRAAGVPHEINEVGSVLPPRD
jgi:hypothetical protein